MSAKIRERQKSLAKIPQILRNVLSHKPNQYYHEETSSLFELTVLAVEKMWFRTSRRTVTEWRGSPSKCVVGSIVSEAALYVVQMGEKEKNNVSNYSRRFSAPLFIFFEFSFSHESSARSNHMRSVRQWWAGDEVGLACLPNLSPGEHDIKLISRSALSLERERREKIDIWIAFDQLFSHDSLRLHTDCPG